MALIRDHHRFKICQAEKKQTAQKHIVSETQDCKIKPQKTKDGDQRRAEFRQRLADRDTASAGAAPSPLEKPTEHRDQLRGTQHMPAGGAAASAS